MAWARAKLFLAPALVTPREPDQVSLFCGLRQGKTDKEGNPCLVDYLPYDTLGKPLQLSPNGAGFKHSGRLGAWDSNRRNQGK